MTGYNNTRHQLVSDTLVFVYSGMASIAALMDVLAKLTLFITAVTSLILTILRLKEYMRERKALKDGD